jgi:CBS domain containing-hemolysin-like protein
VRAAIHLASLTAFAVAGISIARHGRVWWGMGAVAGGAVASGVLWILSSRPRRSRGIGGPHAEGVPTAREGSGGAGPAEGSEGDLEPIGRALLSGLVGLDRIRIAGLMVPRDRIVFADLAGGAGEVLERIRSSRHLRIPMADGSLDRIVGFTHAKDLIPHVAEGRSTPPLKGLIRRAVFVPKDRSASRLLDLFRSHRTHVAIVVDEYGRTAGLISRNDVLRRLAGEGEEGP